MTESGGKLHTIAPEHRAKVQKRVDEAYDYVAGLPPALRGHVEDDRVTGHKPDCLLRKRPEA